MMLGADLYRALEPIRAAAEAALVAPTSTAAPTFWLGRLWYLRWLGIVYTVANLVALRQNRALIGAKGLLPLTHLLHVHREFEDFWERPTLFWWCPESVTDVALDLHAVVGLALAVPLAITGGGSAIQLFLLWALYTSVVNVGQLPYSFGWESQLLETGFIGIFLCPLLPSGAIPHAMPPPLVCVWAARWLLFRIMLGAGLIKVRGDRCWRDLTAMDYFYETQPIPNPLSRAFHFAPKWWHRAETFVGLWVVEIVTPFLLLLPGGGVLGAVRTLSAVLQVGFQLVLLLSGNLSFLNWLTITPAFLCLSDRFLAPFVAHSTRVAAANAAAANTDTAADAFFSGGSSLPHLIADAVSRLRRHQVASLLLLAVVATGSVPVVRNLLARGRTQAMNRSFGVWRFVNTYGAFGSVTKIRYEVVVEGTADESPTDEAAWREYEFLAKPGDLKRSPPVVSPYHLRLDWLMWFLPFSSWRANPWLLRLAAKLLQGDPQIRRLIRHDPFQRADLNGENEDDPAQPTWIRCLLYEYRFAPFGSGAHWERELVRVYLPPVSSQSAASLLARAGLPTS